ncbi:MAG: hypothetical protein AABX11_06105 [Nanoarchaeota archaeon]
MAIKNTLYEALINRGKIQSSTEIVALAKEYKEKFKVKLPKDLLKYLSRHKYIRRIFQGYYYINSFDERNRGFCNYSAKERLFYVLNKEKIKWYLGLNTALYEQGKTWQTPVLINIINTKLSGIKNMEGIKVKFIKTKESLIFGIKELKTKNKITYFYSDPAKTYIDKVYFKQSEHLTRLKNTQTYLRRYPKWVGKR